MRRPHGHDGRRSAEDGALHPLQEAFADLGGAQCGYCTPAILLTAKALLDREPQPDAASEISEALSGNLCRCTGYLQIIEAVEKAAEQVRAGASGCERCEQVRTGASGAGSATDAAGARMSR